MEIKEMQISGEDKGYFRYLVKIKEMSDTWWR